MFDEIQKIIFPNQLSSFDYIKINKLLETYTEEQIIETYRRYGYKPFNYIEKVIDNVKKTPDWLNKEIVNQEIDIETEKEAKDFNRFIESFRNDNK
jgi:DNA-binding winged helix-turn-helix (wHTH) protein